MAAWQDQGKMSFPVSTIRQAILNNEEEVRLTALKYFTDSYSADESLMPLVIRAVEEYGRDNAFRILRDAENLRQTDATLDWLIDELRHDFHTKDVAEDNYRFAVAIVIRDAPVALLERRQAELDKLPAFPDELRGPLRERIEMSALGLEQGWEAMEALGRETMRKGEFSQGDYRRAKRIIECLAKYPDERGDFTLALLKQEYPGKGNKLMDWLHPQVVQLAGEMRLKQAVPVLVDLLDDEYENVADESCVALGKIGGDEVVDALVPTWNDADDDLRHSIAHILEHIHTDHCAERCLTWLRTEDEFDVQLALGHAVLAHYRADGIEPVRLLVNDDEEDMVPDQFDLRYRLLAVSTIMGESFPEYDEWYEDALETNFGWGERDYYRLADVFRPKPVGPKHSGNGRG